MFENLRMALQNKNITIKSYAEFLGVSEKTVQNKLRGVTEFSLFIRRKDRRQGELISTPPR